MLLIINNIDSISSLFRVVLPIVIQTVISCILIYKLSVLKINVTTLSLKKEYRFTFTMVIINLLFIFSQLLLLIGLIFTNIYGYNQTYISTTSNESAVSSFFQTCAILCSTFINTNLLMIYVVFSFILYIHRRITTSFLYCNKKRSVGFNFCLMLSY